MSVSVHEVIEQLKALPSTAERGTAFEKLMLRYFELDPALSQQYDRVWMWRDWPGRDGRPDTGIDLVARAADTGGYTAIQCKFYDPSHTLAKADIDSFFTESGKAPFTGRIIISTTDKWSSHAEESLAGQQIPVTRIGLAEIADSPIRWDVAWPQPGLQIEVAMERAVKHRARQHQTEAIDAVMAGFAAGNTRGKLIMACGTGKTFTALRIAEQIADENGGQARVLFAVPSISLLSQTLRAWAAQCRVDLRAFAVCSDSKVSKAAEDIATWDLEVPVTTDGGRLAEALKHRRRARGLTVVFTTYQSLQATARAQAEYGADPFDLVVCDEAHRTTGVTLAGEDESAFVKIHDDAYIHAARRLYMTATPRLYSPDSKAKADDHDALVASMDDEATFGPEFHRLSFGAAVERGLLSDYKVLVLTVDADAVSAPMQAQMADGFGELRLDDASRIIGCWNGLAKRAGTAAGAPEAAGFGADLAPMRRAVAFAQDIAASKAFANLAPAVVDGYRDMLQTSLDDGAAVNDTNLELAAAVKHVDGTMNALARGEALRWLKAPITGDECRILSNARCLSEGVDVPALDAVMFLHPRRSVVDVVQSVGRVMRKADGKTYGYIILPVAVPAGVSPAEALADNQRFKIVWDVLGALRSHDERFNAMVNSIALNKTDLAKGKGTSQLFATHINPVPQPKPETEQEGVAGKDPWSHDQAAADRELAKQMALFSLSEWQEAIYTRIVDKVGTRTYWEEWASDVAGIASALTSRIHAVLDHGDPTIDAAFDRFVTGLQGNLNDSITADDAIGMLAQHLITKPVFDALFGSHEFAAHNPISQVMDAMVATLGGAGLEAETQGLQGFYDSVRRRAAEVTTAEGKQQVIADLYEKFFRIGFRRQAEALGIVYTPTQIVDFILRSANQALQVEFGKSLTDPGVHILDPFTGTGTFITRLLQSGLIKPGDLARKYGSELHANEILLLAYYIAAVNIETTYHALATEHGDGDDGGYERFEGIVLADTFQIHEAGDTFDAVMFPANNDRITAQLAAPITVIVGNPPYSVGQGSANDLNANLKYATLDGRIEATYAARSTAAQKKSLYDSYIRALRWATDRIGGTGIVAFVSNGGWIDSNTADGIRLTLADEYSSLWVFNLRGNQRTAGELSRKEGGKIFGSGSRSTVAVTIGVKNLAHTGPCAIHYGTVGDYLTREEKLDILARSSLDGDTWQIITPNRHGDWVNQRDEAYLAWPAIGNKKRETAGPKVFRAYSSGVNTSRDAWCYSYSQVALDRNVRSAIDFYNDQVDGYRAYCASHDITDRARYVSDYIDTDPNRISWSAGLTKSLVRGSKLRFDSLAVRPALYRPFSRRAAYLDTSLCERPGRMLSIFPTLDHTNLGIVLIGPGESADFAALTTDLIPDFHLIGSSQFFPRWTYEKPEHVAGTLDFNSAESDVDEYGYRRVDNVTDEILALYTSALGAGISKDDVFYFVYGQLHDPSYREKYAADLKKMLPHIPTPSSRARFDQLADAGRRLADLHVGYEHVPPYPDVRIELRAGADPADRETWRVSKMKWKVKGDYTTLVYNNRVTIAGIPEAAQRYMLGSRSAIDWLIDRYQVKTDKASGIVNDPNDWCDEHLSPRYIADLVARIATVAVETMAIVDGL